MATSSILGPAPIVDFDGTLARLPIDWPSLRRQVGVARIDDLWRVAGDPGADERWLTVTRAEVEAATIAEPVVPVLDALEEATSIAILTSNAAAAVSAFTSRFPALAERVVLVVGRDELRGPKTDFDRFSTGFRWAVDATAAARDGGELVYVGDASYELGFARRLGAVALDVATMEAQRGHDTDRPA